MKQDIPMAPVEGVAIAIAPDDPALPADAQTTWAAWLLNNNDFAIHTVLIVSEGYGEHNGQAVTTSKLRYYFEQIGPHEAHRVESLDPALFHLTTQFWVSYYRDAQIFDKKYVFVPGSLEPANLAPVPLLDGRPGVLHM